MSPIPVRFLRCLGLALLSAMAVMSGGCANAPTPTAPAVPAAAPAAAPKPPAAAPGAATSAAAPPAAVARPPATGTPPPFADITKDATRSDGFLPLWTKDDKTWLEIPAERLDRPFFFGSSQASGLGERFFFPGLMGAEKVVVLRRVGQSVQLLARNLNARAPEGTPLSLALAESFSDSLLAAAPLAAAPHPQRKSLLVDASALFNSDLSGMQTLLEIMFRLPYSLDRANSSIARARTQAGGTHITMRAHYSIPKLPAPPAMAPGAPPPNPAALPSPPRTLPDPRSLFLNIAYTLAPLPDAPMKPRRADQRVGYFTESFIDFGDDSVRDRRTHLITRWRLEKQDPAAELSDVRQPIRVVMDRNIPEQWRSAVRAGILAWIPAFERAGLRNAIAVEQQPADADWSTTEGTRLLAVRWFAVDGPGFGAVGPSQVDPRTGEILRGAAIIPENWARLDRSRLADTQPRLAAAEQSGLQPRAGDFARRLLSCTLSNDALEQAQFGFELLAARGAIDPRGPEAERFIADSLTSVTMHEVGHALGLRHNFTASTGVSRAQLRDAAFTAQRGISNSVMDYNALNLPLEGEAIASVHMTTAGAYDLWAIEYGYREFPAEREAQELAVLAARSEHDANLRYATDEDAAGPDPEVNRFDLGDDPLAFAGRQLKLARELWQRTQARTLSADDDMTVYRRNLQRVLATVNASVPVAVRHVGGTLTSRALAGAGQPLLTPVPAARQRDALSLVLDEVFTSSSFRFDPRVMSRLGVEQLDRLSGSRTSAVVDFSLGEEVLRIQRGALDALISDGLATRLADAEVKVEDPRTLLSYAEVQQRLAAAVWSELKTARVGKVGKPGLAPAGDLDIDSLRRSLQREHLRRLAGGLLRPGSAAPADVRAVHRQAALQLEADLKAALAVPGWSAIAHAHLADSLATMSEALRAPLNRQGV